MKLQRIYHKIEDLSLSLKWLRGDEYESLYTHVGQGPKKDLNIEQVTFGYSYVADMKMRPYEGRHRDYYAAIDIYSNNRYVIGIPAVQMAYLKDALISEKDTYISHFNGSYRAGEKCSHTGQFMVTVNKNDLKAFKYYASIFFSFRRHFEEDRILCLTKGDVARLIRAFNVCEMELSKVVTLPVIKN